jgi:hypothetical protein
MDAGTRPQTFQDSVALCLALAIPYLSTDSLCIVQGSKDDWMHEASLMSLVCSNARMNIAATPSRDGTGGLFRQRPLLHYLVINASGNNLPKGSFLLTHETIWFTAHLNTRVWVLQEKLLAERTLHFACHQVW